MMPSHVERLRGSGTAGTFVAELYDFFIEYHRQTYGDRGRADPRRRRRRAGAPARHRRDAPPPRRRGLRVAALPRPHGRRPLAPDGQRAERRRRRRHRRGRLPRAALRARRVARLVAIRHSERGGADAAAPRTGWTWRRRSVRLGYARSRLRAFARRSATRRAARDTTITSCSGSACSAPGSSSRSSPGWRGTAASSARRSPTGSTPCSGPPASACRSSSSALGALMVARASLVDVKPFRTGLVLLCVGALVLLGEERGGAFGTAFDAVFGRLIGGTGHVHPRPLPLLGRRAPAHRRLPRRHAAPLRARRARHRRSPRGARSRAVRVPPRRPALGPDPDHVSNGHCAAGAAGRRRGGLSRTWSATRRSLTAGARRPARAEPLDAELDLETDDAPEPPTLFDPPTSEHADYRLPDAYVLRRSRPARGPARQGGRADGRGAPPGARQLRDRRDARRPGRRAARDPLRAPARARDEGREGRGAQGRPRLRARDHGDPHPRARSRASRRSASRCPNLSPNIVTLGDIFDEPPPSARARSPSGSARTSPAPRCTPTSPACRTSSSPARPARGSPAASTRCSAPSSCARRRTTCG